MSEKKTRSLRMFVLISVGIAAVCCVIIIVGIFTSNMSKLLNTAEEDHMSEQSRVIHGVLYLAMENLYSNTRAWASRGSTYDYIARTNLDFAENNFGNNSMLDLYNVDYVFINSKTGNNIFTASRYEEKAPDSLLHRISVISADVLKNQLRETMLLDRKPYFDLGFIVDEQQSYLICVMPVAAVGSYRDVIGTFTFAVKFSDEQIRELTYLDASKFEIIEQTDPPISDSFVRKDSGIITMRTVIKNVGNERDAVLQFDQPRTLYQNGRAIMLPAVTLLVVFIILLLAVLFYILNWYLLIPLERIIGEIGKAHETTPIDVGKYARAKEFNELSIAINDMLRRLEQSHEAERRTKVSVTVLENVLNSMEAYVYVSDPQTDEILFINEPMKKHYGITDDGIGKICWQIFMEDKDSRCDFCPCNKFENDPDTPVVWEEYSGETDRFYRNTDRLIDWVGGKKVHLQHSVNITNIKKAELSLRKLSSIVESSSQFISYISDGKITYVNPVAEKITGYTQEELINGGIELIHNKKDAEIIHAECIPVTLRDGQYECEMELIRKDGEKRLMAYSSFVINAATGETAKIATDITEVRRLETELISAKEQAEQGSIAKGEFLSRMSHEMRTPMNAIIGMTNIARGTKDPAKKEICLEKIDNASRHLLGVINDILDISKIEADRFELAESEFSFDKMLMSALDVTNFRMEEKRQELSVYIDPSIPAMLFGDEQRLSQVITNLISNAVKFTQEGGRIELNAHITEETGDKITLQIEVIDNGIGIKEENQQKLFYSFEQGDGSIARKFGGTGLGLAICKRIVTLMDGDIRIESKPGEGSKFIFTVKMRRGEEPALESLKRKISLNKLNILVVDDSAETRDYFTHIMKQTGIPCKAAYSGTDALDIVGKSETPFDIIFIDWQMPDMDGVQLTRKLRERTGDKSIIVMISVAEWSEIQNEAIAAGAQGFVPKPLFPSLIIDCINKYFRSELNDTELTGISGRYNFHGKTILLAEDIDINREIVTTVLNETGIVIECAENGRQAAAMFMENPGKYDMIFMDMHMPEVDGLEATRKIRAIPVPEAVTVPIIAMTANVFKEDIEKCIEAGMDDHIGKPIDFEDLFEKLRRYF